MVKISRIKKAIPVIGGILGGILEYYPIREWWNYWHPIIPDSEYRAAYIAALSLPFLSKDKKAWIQKSIMAMTAQDAFFWVLDYLSRHELPFQWSWYYPVFDHVPELYPISLMMIWVLRKKKVKLPPTVEAI